MAAERVLGVDVGGSAIKVWVAGADGMTARSSPLPTIRPIPSRVEFDPAQWWDTIRHEIRATVAQCGYRASDYLGLVLSSMRQAFVLVSDDRELGAGILNSDRRGAAFLERLRKIPELYEVTRHWPAPELTLGKLMAVAAAEPDRWAGTRRILFVHDWLIWRLTGVQVTEVSYACAGQMAAVEQRRWAVELLRELDLDTGKLAVLVEPGTLVGRIQDSSLGLPVGLPVYAGCGDTQLAAMGAGGLGESVATVVTGSSTPVQIATERPLLDDQQRPWVSTHARPDLWAAETNAGYPGTMALWLRQAIGSVRRSGHPGADGITATVATPHWTEYEWATKAPMALLGLNPSSRPEDLAQAIDEAHAYAVRANLADLEQAQGRPAAKVIVTGGGARNLAPLLADVLGRPLEVCPGSSGTARAGWALVTGSTRGDALTRADPASYVVRPAAHPDEYITGYRRYLDTHAVLRTHLPVADP